MKQMNCATHRRSSDHLLPLDPDEYRWPPQRFPKSVRYLRVCYEPDDRPNAFKPRYSESPFRNRHNRPSLGKGRKNLYVAGMNWSRGDLHENIIRPEFFALKLTLG